VTDDRRPARASDNRGRPDRASDGRGRPDRAGDRRGDGRRGPVHGDRPAGWKRSAVDAPRQAAYDAVSAVHRDDAYANLALPAILRDYGLHGRDAAFATEMTYGTLRAGGTLDAVIAIAAGRDVAKIDPPVRDALRLGAYQLLYTRVPPHAAVSTTVDLVRSVGTEGGSGFANAVMRQIAEKPLDDWLATVAPDEAVDRVGHLAVTRHHPQWIVRAFAEALGGDLDETERLLAEDNERPTVHLCARPGRISTEDLVDETGGAPGAFSPYAVYLLGGAPGDIEAVASRAAHVQDEGSQLVALALADAPVDGPDARWLDLCAGPGGKAGLLGALAAERGARLTAIEVTPHRADLIAATTAGLPVDVVCTDGRTVGTDRDLPADSFDRVLVDAPCTGLGALRRRPEARWRRTPADLPPLTKLQRELLTAAFRAVRPGGLVAYVTCSPHVVETQVTVIESARRAPVTMEFVDARPFLPAGMPGLGSGPTVQLWPHRHGTDAMFIALLRRAD
jgi:16S rRNA (cytosine967-C5)-methyltransferase